jgi:xanthine dehydrogenase small subunit
VLQHLREDLHCTGTKKAAEGDCGACTVVVGSLNAAGELEMKAVNSCIQFAPTLDGKALFTVEDLQQPGRRAASGAAGDGGMPRFAVRLLHARLRHVLWGMYRRDGQPAQRQGDRRLPVR